MAPLKENKIKMDRLLRLVLSLLCIVMPLLTLAQEGPADPQDTPIDGGLGLLIAAGVGYGVKKYRDAKNARVIEK